MATASPCVFKSAFADGDIKHLAGKTNAVLSMVFLNHSPQVVLCKGKALPVVFAALSTLLLLVIRALKLFLQQ